VLPTLVSVRQHITSIRPALDRGFTEELKIERRNTRAEGRSERGSEQRSERLARRDRRRSQRENAGGSGNTPVVTPPSGTQGTDLVTIQPVPNPSTPNSTTPTPTTTPVATTKPTGDSVKGLAEKYVDTYTQQSGRTISASTREALVNDVASFYGENGGRTERLRSLVGVF
jgi:hypothetical protein